MPTTQIVRRSALQSLTGLSMSTLYRLIARGEFPAQIRLSEQAVGWQLCSVEAWIETRKAVAR